MAGGFHMPVGSSTREAYRVLASRPKSALQEWGRSDRAYYNARWDDIAPRPKLKVTGTVRERTVAKAIANPPKSAGWAADDPRWER